MEEMRNKSLAVVSSPFQILTLLEAVSIYNVHSCEVVLLDYGHQKTLDKNKKLLSTLNFNFVRVVNCRNKLSTFKSLFKLLKVVSSGSYKLCFYGDIYYWGYRLLYLNSKPESFFLEDGTSTFTYDRLKSGKKFFEVFDITFKTERVLSIISALSGLKTKSKNKPKIISALPFEPSWIELIGHDFRQLKSSIKKETTSLRSVFVGGPLVDLGILTEQYYLDILRKVIEIESRAGKNYYFAHRKESNEIIDKIKDLGYEVVLPDTLIELYMCQNGLRPESIYSVFSTSILTLGKLFPESKTIMCDLDQNKILDRKENILYLQSFIKTKVTSEFSAGS